jgi:hypothetical protein
MNRSGLINPFHPYPEEINRKAELTVLLGIDQAVGSWKDLIPRIYPAKAATVRVTRN